ncbi:ribokinase [Solilutibacter silvestris]|uniref:Ribokinase n=1 Tax=Solilutibacter silvestris TaxID=1645665 RepID=A0A2K1Q0D9_9GAMM|nr:ribokinase [Lysobacter silvestris]PNS08508.1 Sugar kinases ribokinase family [Lysobacter silvestris]
MKVLVAGSANLDFVVRAAHVPAPGETVLGRELQLFPGGKGANQAVAAARAGDAHVSMLLALGDDAFVAQLEAPLRDAGVDAHIVRVAGTASGSAFICIADDGENSITVAPGANLHLAPEHLPALQGFSHVLMQLEVPIASVQAYAQAARAANVKVVLNAAPAQALPRALLDCVDVLIVNEGELAALAGSTTQADVSGQCAAIGIPCIVVTLGACGAWLWRRDQALIEQPAFAVDVVDTTGAGDVFCGTLTALLAQGAAFEQAMRYATAASALACTKLGAQSGTPTRVELERFLADRRD